MGVDLSACELPNGEQVLVDSLPVGDGVLFTHKTVHCSLPNNSPAARWSLDLRYSVLGMPTGRPAVPGFVGRSQKVRESTHQEWKEALACGGSYVPPSDGGKLPPSAA